jgi:hypothetical protein
MLFVNGWQHDHEPHIAADSMAARQDTVHDPGGEHWLEHKAIVYISFCPISYYKNEGGVLCFQKTC